MLELKPFGDKSQTEAPLRLYWHGGFLGHEFVSQFILQEVVPKELQSLEVRSLGKVSQNISEDKPFVQADELWQHTCWEVFFKESDGESYLETNLSTRGSWQCYQFKKYRERDLAAQPALRLQALLVETGDQKLSVSSRWHLSPGMILPTKLKAYPRAVLKCKDSLTFWAPNHPLLTPPRPDFHLFT